MITGKWKGPPDKATKKLLSLKKQSETKIIRAAVKEAAPMVVSAVRGKAEAVRLRGFLAKSIGQKIKVYNKDKAVLVVGPKSKYTRKIPGSGKPGAKRIAKPSRYISILEHGSKRSRPRPVIAPARRAVAQSYLDTVAKSVGTKIFLALGAT